MSDLPTYDDQFETNVHVDETALKADLEELDRRKRAMRAAQAEADRLKEHHDVLEQQVYDKMDLQDTWTLKTSTRRFSGKSTTYAVITDMDELRAWLDEQGLEDEFLKEAPQKARLNELVREYLDNGQTMPPGLSSYDKRYVSITDLTD